MAGAALRTTYAQLLRTTSLPIFELCQESLLLLIRDCDHAVDGVNGFTVRVGRRQLFRQLHRCIPDVRLHFLLVGSFRMLDCISQGSPPPHARKEYDIVHGGPAGQRPYESSLGGEAPQISSPGHVHNH